MIHVCVPVSHPLIHISTWLVRLALRYPSNDFLVKRVFSGNLCVQPLCHVLIDLFELSSCAEFCNTFILAPLIDTVYIIYSGMQSESKVVYFTAQ